MIVPTTLEVPVKLVFPDAETVVNAPVLAEPDPIAPGEAKVAPFNEDAFKFATLVVEETVNGAVPVATFEIKLLAVIEPLIRGEVEYAGVVDEEVLFPNIVYAPAFNNVAFNVPLVMTAVEGAELKIVPSPVNVTDVTEPPLPVA